MVEKANEFAINFEQKHEAATFEEAIAATGYGKFNIIIILITIPAIFATMFETTAIAYVVPVAQCDLELRLEDKGYLISMTYLGMVSSAMVWGFLSDTLGRRKVMIAGLFVNGFFVTMGGLAQSFTVLIISKFMGGFIINGPYAIATTIVSEYHCAKHRARTILLLGVIFSSATITLPIMALGIFSAPIDISLFDGYLKLHSWNILLLITALPSFLSALGYLLCIPETPKFLMTSGDNEHALKVLRKVYAFNTGKDPDTYPIKILVDETQIISDGQMNVVSSNKWVAFKNGFAQMRPLIKRPHFVNIVLVCFLQLGTLMGLNSLRLWLPQLFSYINDYHTTQNHDAGICTILEANIYNKSQEAISEMHDEFECSVNYDNTFAYINLLIISVGTIVGYLFVGTLINCMGKKILYVSLGVLSGLAAGLISYTPNGWSITALSTLTLALSGINSNVLITIIVDLFPTTLRTMAVALAMMVARAGSMVGNLFFPHLINAGCMVPFLYIGSTTFFCALLAILLPKTDMKALQ